MAFAGIIIAILTASLIVLSILYIVLLSKKYEEIDSNIHINFASKYAHGRFIGAEISSEKGKGDRELITMIPKDVSFRNLTELKPVMFAVGKNKKITLPMGTLSKERHIVFDLPDKSDDFPKEFLITPLGKFLAFYTEIQNTENVALESKEEGKKRMAIIINNLGDGEASRTWIKSAVEFMEDTLKLKAMEKQESKFHLPPIERER